MAPSIWRRCLCETDSLWMRCFSTRLLGEKSAGGWWFWICPVLEEASESASSTAYLCNFYAYLMIKFHKQEAWVMRVPFTRSEWNSLGTKERSKSSATGRRMFEGHVEAVEQDIARYWQWKLVDTDIHPHPQIIFEMWNLGIDQVALEASDVSKPASRFWKEMKTHTRSHTHTTDWQL